MNGKYIATLLFLALSALGTLYLLVEAVLQSLGKSICATEGCKVVAQFTRFGDLTMALLGLGTLAVITIAAVQEMRAVSARRDRIVNFLLVAALAGEGYFVGYQLFRLHAVCVFCLSVFGIFVVLGVLRILAGHVEAALGFGALLAVLSLFYIVLPAGGTALPSDQQYVLFYSTDCRHCSEIRSELAAMKLEVRHVEVKEHAATLKNLGIEHVPTLMVSTPLEKTFLTGTEAIRRYLASRQQARQAPGGKMPARPLPAPGKKSAPKDADAGTLNFLAPGTLPFNLSPDEGICKEEVKCD